MKKLKIKKLHPNAITPKYATEGAACFDLHALDVEGYETINIPVTEDAEPVLCRTGLAFDIPDGYVMLVFSRSGHGFKHNTRLSNCVGIIDSDYVGEVMVKLTCDFLAENAPPFVVKAGDRVAQAMLMPVEQWQIEEVNELKTTKRGTGGFGSTGK